MSQTPLALLTTPGMVHIERPLTDLFVPQAMDDTAIVVRRRKGGGAIDLFRMPLWPMPAIVALLVIVVVVGIGLFGPAQWVSLGTAVGMVIAGYVYYAFYLRPRNGTQFLMLEAREG